MKKRKMKFSTKVEMYRLILVSFLTCIIFTGITLASPEWLANVLDIPLGASRIFSGLFWFVIFWGGWVLMRIILDIYVKIMQDKGDGDKR